MKLNSKMDDVFKLTVTSRLTEFYDTSCEIQPKKTEGVFSEVFPDSTHRVSNRMTWKYLTSSNTEEKYVENLTNIFSSTDRDTVTIVVCKGDNKVTLKVFKTQIFRKVGRPFFQKSTSVHFLTYNYVNNSLYLGHILNYHKKRKCSKKIRRVNSDTNPINVISHRLNDYLCYMNVRLNGELRIGEIISKVLDSFISSIPDIETCDKSLSHSSKLFKLIFDKKGVKLPNNWEFFLQSYPQPKKKDLIKSKYKYIDALMNLSDLSGDKIKRVMHSLVFYSPNNVLYSFEMFGKKYILSQPDSVLKSIFESKFYLSSAMDLTKILNKTELNNAFKIYTMVLDGVINFTTFSDHIQLYLKLKSFELIRWKSNTYEEFNNEHFEWSERYSFYTKGDYYRTYPDEFLNRVQTEINVGGEKYCPVLLTNSKEYNLESFVQSNCVKGYIDRAPSFIISLRNSDFGSTERATIEYRVTSSNGKLLVKRAQTLGRFNGRLDETWDAPVKILDKVISDCVNNDIFELPKLKVLLGYKVIDTKATVTDTDTVKWMEDLNASATIDYFI